MNKEYDALYFHGQGYSDRIGRNPVPSVRGRLQASAIRKLINENYRFGKVLFSGIPFKDQQLSMAEVNADAVKRRSKVESERMIVDNTARTTSMEVDFVAHNARKNKWKRIVHLTYGDEHDKQIRQLVKDRYDNNVEVDVFRADELLLVSSGATSVQDRRNIARYQSFIDAYNVSDTEQGILSYERKKSLVMKLPFDFGSTLLNFAAKFYRPDPS